MKISKISILVAFMSVALFSCNEDDEVSAPSDNPHDGEIVYVELGYTDFVGASSLKSSSVSFEDVTHNYVTTGYTVTIKDVYDEQTGDFVDSVYTNVDLSTPNISFNAIEWFGIEVVHPSYVASASGSEAYYSVTNDRVIANEGAPVLIPLDLTQVSVHLANGTGQEFNSQIDVATINGVEVTDFNLPVYVPAVEDYIVSVTFNQSGEEDEAINFGNSGEAFYHVISDQSIGTGVIFELPVFEAPTDGGGIGN